MSNVREANVPRSSSASPVKLYAICLVKNEDDVIAQTLAHASQYCDRIFVIDNGSTDRTWEIVQDLAKRNPAVVAFAQKDEPYDEGLRWLAYDAHHRVLTERDWWLILDGDEFLAEDPRPAIAQALRERADVISAWQIQFYYTEKDYEAWKSGRDGRNTPIYLRRRYYRIDWQEPRLFRNQTKPNVIFRQSKLLTPVTPWGAAVVRIKGKVSRRRVWNRHYQYRDPEQMEKRLRLRYGNPAFAAQVASLDWNDVLRSSKTLKYYEDGASWRFSLAGLVHYYRGRWRYVWRRTAAMFRELMHATRPRRPAAPSTAGPRMTDGNLPPVQIATPAPMTTQAPLVSVVIPTCNRANLLARAIKSVQSQTHQRLEIIVVDDASADRTCEVVRGFSDSRIRYIRHTENRGGSAARNTGIHAAAGELIAFLDDDDEWEPHKTEEQLKLLQHYHAVTCTSDAIGAELARLATARTAALPDLLRGEFTFGGTGVLMARAHVLKDILFDETLPRYQDWDLFIRIALKYEIAYLNKPLLHSGSVDRPRITTSILRVPLTELEQQFRMLDKHKELFGTALYRQHMCKSLLYGITQRPDKLRLIAYAAWRYGIANVVRIIGARVAVLLRGNESRARSNPAVEA